jgi:uncharacterized protein
MVFQNFEPSTRNFILHQIPNMNWKKWLRRSLRLFVFLFVLLNIIAAFHAYKFTHFYPGLGGKLKKPEQWTFSDKASAILFGVKYPKSENFTHPAGRYDSVQLRTADSILIDGWYIYGSRKADTTAASAPGTVLLFHGHGGCKSSHIAEGDFFQQLGYNVLMIDFRAHGNSGGNTCTIGRKEAEEVKLAYDFVKNKGEKNIILWGTSMGAATITSAIENYPELQPQKIILEMPFATLLDAVEGRVRIMGLPEQPVASLLAFWGGAEQGFWAFGYKPGEYAKKIKSPTLLQWGANDNRVKRSEMEQIFNNINLPKKELVVYEKSGHQSLCVNEPDKWKEKITAFLRN